MPYALLHDMCRYILVAKIPVRMTHDCTLRAVSPLAEQQHFLYGARPARLPGVT